MSVKEIIEIIDISNETCDYIQALFEDYMAKKDLLTTIFDLHKMDEDSSILTSVPFKNYEKEFAKIKVQYDTAMQEISNTYIPNEYKENGYNFEINFDKSQINIYRII